MNKEQIKEKILLEKNASLIDILEINNNCYAKALITFEGVTNIEFKYYKISDDSIKDIEDSELKEVKSYFETNLGNIVY